MLLRELTAEIIGARVTVTQKGKPFTGTVIGYGWGSTDGKEPTEGRIDFYGGTSVTLSLDAEVTVEP